MTRFQRVTIFIFGSFESVKIDLSNELSYTFFSYTSYEVIAIMLLPKNVSSDRSINGILTFFWTMINPLLSDNVKECM